MRKTRGGLDAAPNQGDFGCWTYVTGDARRWTGSGRECGTGDLIASTKWRYVSGSGYRLSVTPTNWGKTTGIAARGAAWTEVKAKTPGTRENTQVYEKQLLCHFDGRAAVIAREGWNATWDLEGWRPNVSYGAYVQALCNP